MTLNAMRTVSVMELRKLKFSFKLNRFEVTIIFPNFPEVNILYKIQKIA